MKSRRNFITKAGMASAAVLLLKPFNGLASSPLARKLGFTTGSSRLVLLHTASNVKYIHYAEKKIASLTNSSHNILLLKNEPEVPNENNYEIINKDGIKTGIIKTDAGSTLADINSLAAHLKKDKECQLVVCHSSFGYKNKNGVDDIKLAESSTDIDIIIGNHPTNNTPLPIISRNSQRAEVIIHHAANNGFGLGNIELEFDDKNSTKRFVAINNLLTRLPQTA